MQSNPCDPCNPPVVKWVNPQPQPAQIWNPCDPCAPVMYNPCPPVNCNPCPPTEAQLRGGKDFFNIQVTELTGAGPAPGGTKPLSNFCGGRKAILVVNVADADPAKSLQNMTQLRTIRNQYPAGDFEILAFPCNQFGYALTLAPPAIYTNLANVGGVAPLPYKVFED